MLPPWENSYSWPRQHIKKKKHHFTSKSLSSQSYGFSSSHVWMCKLEHRESWSPMNWYFFRTVVLEKMLESPLDCRDFKPINPKGNQSWIFIGWTDTEAEAPILGHLMRRPDSLGKPWCCKRLKAGEQRMKTGMAEDEMVGWHH